MILIADSGSTKTDWRVIGKDQNIEQIYSEGFNPYYENSEAIRKKLQRTDLMQFAPYIKEIYFYGAGCSVEKNCGLLHTIFKEIFPQASIMISHDLLAAARALCGHQAGIACILGTGANACLYDGQEIVSDENSLGFILGDEGSGAHLGKKLVVAYLQNDLPVHLMEKFKQKYDLTRALVLENVYQKPFPSRYLASFTRFIFHHLQEPYCYSLVYASFEDFFKKYVCTLPNQPNYQVHFTGAIAFYYSNILRQVASDMQISLGRILEKPIAGLTLYHQV